VVAIGLNVSEGVGPLVEDDVELAFLDPLVEPGAAEDESADPVDEALVGAADELEPVRVDVLAEGRGRFADLAVDGELDEVVELLGVEPGGREVELHGGLLDALGEVGLVECEAELSVLENVVGARLVVASACSSFHLDDPLTGSPSRVAHVLQSPAADAPGRPPVNAGLHPFRPGRNAPVRGDG
jgi:hypothetical protein